MVASGQSQTPEYAMVHSMVSRTTESRLMNIERTYIDVSWFFHAWVGIMENHTRKLEVNDSSLHDSKILIISPPTDRGIEALAQANQSGSTYLLCFSTEIEDLAKKYCQHRGIHGVQTVVAPFFSIPGNLGELDAIYANCFLDCCPPSKLDVIIDELWRALRQGGVLYSVHMGIPSHLMSHLWTVLFRSIPGPSRGFHPTDIVPSLSSRGFTVMQNQQPERFGFPLRYVKAEKTDVVEQQRSGQR